jgi:molybdopterin converting factor small subunit
MRIPVQFYAQLRDLAGTSESNFDLPAGATINELLKAIYQQTPSLHSMDKSILVGAGVEFVDRGYVIKPGETISIMPPVQGG